MVHSRDEPSGKILIELSKCTAAGVGILGTLQELFHFILLLCKRHPYTFSFYIKTVFTLILFNGYLISVNKINNY